MAEGASRLKSHTHARFLTAQTGGVDTFSRSAATAPSDLLLDRFDFQVRERDGFGVPSPHPRPIGSGFDFRCGTTWYELLTQTATSGDPAGSSRVSLRLKNGPPVRRWWIHVNGRWSERGPGGEVMDHGFDISKDGAELAARVFDWIQSMA